MIPFAQALAELGLEGSVDVLPVPSGYPSPRFVNLVLRRRHGQALLFESSVAKEEVIAQVRARLGGLGVERLDALLITHCHGDHGGSAGVIAGLGRPAGERAPIHMHSAGYRFITQPEPSFLQETYEIFLARAQWGLLDYSTLSNEEILENALRNRFKHYFERTPKSALRFVDQGELPASILALETPGHSHDCVLYYDQELGIAVPGDTIICTGAPDDAGTHAYVIPIFTVAGQVYSMAYERFLRTITVLRRFFETHEVRAVLPPHGRFAVTRPLAWVAFAESYFEGIYRALRERFLAENDGPFRACDLSPYIPTAGAHPISTPSHVVGMLCMLADDGFLDMREHPHTRHLTFTPRVEPPPDYVTRLLARDPGRLPLHRGRGAGAARLPA